MLSARQVPLIGHKRTDVTRFTCALLDASQILELRNCLSSGNAAAASRCYPSWPAESQYPPERSAGAVVVRVDYFHIRSTTCRFSRPIASPQIEVVESCACPNNCCSVLRGTPQVTALIPKPWRNPLVAACGPTAFASFITADYTTLRSSSIIEPSCRSRGVSAPPGRCEPY